jgi:hypothetical protein
MFAQALMAWLRSGRSHRVRFSIQLDGLAKPAESIFSATFA